MHRHHPRHPPLVTTDRVLRGFPNCQSRTIFGVQDMVSGPTPVSPPLPIPITQNHITNKITKSYVNTFINTGISQHFEKKRGR